MSAGAVRGVGLGIATLLVLAGIVFGLGDTVAVWIAVVVAVVAALAIFWLRTRRGIVFSVLQVLGAVLIGLLALVGFDVAVNFVHGLLGLSSRARLSIPIGLLLALVVFGLVVYRYLAREGRSWSAPVAVGLAFAIVLGAPYVYGKLTTDTEAVASESVRVASKLDVLLVGDGSRHLPLPDAPPTPALGEFDVSYSVGYADGDAVRWTLDEGDDPNEALRALAEGDGRPSLPDPPRPREAADQVLLLLVDGTSPVVEEPAGLKEVKYRAGEVERWRRVARQAAPGDVPTYPLLQTTDKERLAHWKRFAAEGQAVSAQALESQTATDAAVRLAVAAPTAQTDFALAMRYRPILLFDGGEPVPWPLSIDALFKGERVRLCHNEGLKTDCGSQPIVNPAELENGGTHLRLDLRASEELRRLAGEELESEGAPGSPATGGESASEPGAPPEETPPPGTPEAPPAAGATAPLGSGSAIYVHPVSLRVHGRELLYLDYWWYLPDNPVSLGGGALCGAGLVIAGVTCQSHQSDWEGITVVVDRGEAEPEIVAVQYAQHENVVRYEWETLLRRWEGDATVEKLVGASDFASRPLAFVARGTHAAYPLPCRRCHQVPRPEVGEGPHRGDFPWVGNDSGACGRSSCLQTLPTRRAGSEPALWNAFEGTWGEHHCFLTYYCDSGTPPTAPGTQRRYRHPAHYSGTVVPVGNRWRYRPLVEG